MDLQVKHCVVSNVVSHQGPKDKAIRIAAEWTGKIQAWVPTRPQIGICFPRENFLEK